MFHELANTYTHPFVSFCPFPLAGNRQDWQSLGQKILDRLIEEGEQGLQTAWPSILASDYLDFTRTGRRTPYEDKQFSRRMLLNGFTLAECAEYKGRFLDAVLNGIWSICEESSWCLPAHNSYIRDTPQLPLPDVTAPIIDLFAAETGAVLAMTRYLLKKELDHISPAVSILMDHTLQERIFTPYLTRHFWWMGDGISPMNNWTVWCTQNILLATFLSDLEETAKQQIFQKACQSIDYFLNEYGEDGCCDEGAQYYRHAGLCLFGCMEILNAVTGGHFESLYQEPKIKNIAAYILQAHAAGPYYINFADCSPVAGRCGAREFLFGLRTENPRLMKLAVEDFQVSSDPYLTQEHNLYYRLMTLFSTKAMLSFSTHESSLGDDLYYPSAGLFIVRDDRFCLAVKAGNNDDSHNHNDTGSFTVYLDGNPLFVDIGVETYQKKTFSPDRYAIWTMQSQYHNLPSFAGCRPEEAEKLPYGYAMDFPDLTEESQTGTVIAAMEHNGPQYEARNVAWQISQAFGEISMELAHTYPENQVRSYQRTVRLDKGRGITVTDLTDCGALKPVLSLITYEEPFWDGKDSLLRIGKLGNCRITGAIKVSKERLLITDPRLQTAWKHDLWRILVLFDRECRLEIFS